MTVFDELKDKLLEQGNTTPTFNYEVGRWEENPISKMTEMPVFSQGLLEDIQSMLSNRNPIGQ